LKLSQALEWLWGEGFFGERVWERDARGERELGVVRMSELVRGESDLNDVGPRTVEIGSTGQIGPA